VSLLKPLEASWDGNKGVKIGGRAVRPVLGRRWTTLVWAFEGPVHKTQRIFRPGRGRTSRAFPTLCITMSFPTLTQYSDFREYLRDYYETHKASNPDFSYRYLALRAGINSSAFYKYVIDGKRNLTKASLLKTCLALKLKDRDAEYFENLVFFNQAKTLREKNVFFDRLTKLRGQYETRLVGKDQYAFYSDWYHSAVRELLACLDFRGDYDHLAERLLPPITSLKARESVALLCKLGLAKKNAQGRFIPCDPVLTTGGTVASDVIRDFQLRMLALAAEAYDRVPGEDRLMSTVTLSISPETLDLFRRRIRELKSEMLEAARLDAAADRVYQLNLNLFPLSTPASTSDPKSGIKPLRKPGLKTGTTFLSNPVVNVRSKQRVPK
jgi:uncharacterized protein (TIGR02147 family)